MSRLRDHALLGLPTSSLVLDTNVLLALVVGSDNFESLKNHKRTRSLAIDGDLWEVLLDVVSRFTEIRVTPTILAETSNLLGTSKHHREVLAELLRTWIEVYEPSEDVMRSLPGEYLRLGLTDAAILDLGRRGSVVLTDDALLHRELQSLGCHAVNLVQLRGL